jgi:hypothetical protein
MPTLELTSEQLRTLKAGWKKLVDIMDDDTEISDEIGDSLDISKEARGLEDEDGEELEDYDEGKDPVFKALGEVSLVLANAK